SDNFLLYVRQHPSPYGIGHIKSRQAVYCGKLSFFKAQGRLQGGAAKAPSGAGGQAFANK
ncbi:MAG TPA: hypothetical protein VN446_05625, partial [Candidatus Acidoferrum sp.]|nr:hypothetical protein [Candidatus Acidoferrum sp.]